MASYSGPKTFGIELEYIAVYPVGLFDKGDDHFDVITALSLGCIAKGIKSTGHASLDDDESINGEDGDYTVWSFVDEGGLELSATEKKALGSTDNEWGMDENYEIISLEVASRMLHFEDPNWQTEIETVLSVFDDLRDAGVTFITNSTTGFHIHVGFGAGNGTPLMPLRTVKGVMEICTGFEDRLDALYSTDRINEKAAIAGQHFNAPLAWHFQHNKLTDFRPNVFHWLTSIEEASSFQQLGAFFRNIAPSDDKDKTFMTNAHFSTLNVDNLFESAHDSSSPPTVTIEFRQHGGTLNFEAIVSHVLLKQALVSFCHSSIDKEFLQLFTQISNPTFRLSDLISAIGGSQQLLEYHEERRSYSVERAKAQEYEDTLADIKNGEFEGVIALQAQAFVEHHERSNWAAVSNRIHSKHQVGAYGQNQTRTFDVAGEWDAFIWGNCDVGLATAEYAWRARTMVFQQLNGDDIEFDCNESIFEGDQMMCDE
jgi:hypothetical protein